LDERREIRAYRLERESGDEAGEVIGVRADVAQRAARPGLRRIGAPRRLFLARRLQPLGEQSCAYSTCTTRMSPSSPAATMARAWRAIG